jgi:alkylresorcinol/alkylpyrone synthase
MFLMGLGTAVPPDRYTQRECFGALQTAPFLSTLQPRSRALLRKVLLGANGIKTRHLALKPLAEGLGREGSIRLRRSAQRGNLP